MLPLLLEGAWPRKNCVHHRVLLALDVSYGRHLFDPIFQEKWCEDLVEVASWECRLRTWTRHRSRSSFLKDSL